MEEQEKQSLKKKYEDMPNAELLERLAEGREQYTEIAYNLLLGEVKRRGIEGQINKPKDTQVEVEVSDFKVVKRDYRFYCISIIIVLVISFVLCAIPNFVGVYKLDPQLSLSSILAIIGGASIEFLLTRPVMFQLSILGVIGGVAGIVFLFALDRMAAHLKACNMTKLQSWIWVIGTFIPIVYFVIIIRIFFQSRKLLKKLSVKG